MQNIPSTTSNPNKIVIPGGSGFLGMALADYYAQQNWEVVILSRNPKPAQGNIRFVPWNGRTFSGWEQEFEGAKAVVNLAGKSVNCRYYPWNKKAILRSRTLSTEIVGRAIQGCERPPAVWLNSSSATIYEHSLMTPNSESDGWIGRGFSVDVCKAWEATFAAVECLDTRKIVLRTSIVLGNEGGAFPEMVKIARQGLGGRQGSGQQMVSWLHIHDFVRAVDWLIQQKEASGIYNVVSPHAEKNQDFMALLRQHVGVSFGLPLPKILLEIGAFFRQTETELILKSRYVVPSRLLAEGFQFQFQYLDAALEHLLAPSPAPTPPLRFPVSQT